MESQAFVSHAQNFEDVMLWRALGSVVKGRYVDVGAQHPITDSVSLAFYERGWRGVHIEPIPRYASLLRQHRPDETVQEIALANSSGERDIFEIPDTGLSTFSAEIAQQHQRDTGCEVCKRTVRTMTLDDALSEWSDQEIHWLKIDVEGAEKEVLEGWNGRRIRPWILVVESTRPNSPLEDYQDWEPLVLSKEYLPCYFDGLNRYYVASEHRELEEHFRAPPNVFDNFVPARLIESMVECESLRQRWQEARSQAEQAQREAVLANERVQEIERLALDAVSAAQRDHTRPTERQPIGTTSNSQSQADYVPRIADLRHSYRLIPEDLFVELVLAERHRR